MCATLLYFQLELFGLLLFLAESVVFVYFFVLYVSSDSTESGSRGNSLVVLSIFLLVLPASSVYSPGKFTYWFTSFIESTDVLCVYINIYEHNSVLLLLIAVLLAVLTIVAAALSSLAFKSLSMVSGSQFAQKKQNKSTQIFKKPATRLFSGKQSDL